jgi:hypothetical protein
MRPTLSPITTLIAAFIVATVLCAVFLALLASGPTLDVPASTLATSTAHRGGWMASFAPCGLLLAVLGAGVLAGALFRPDRRVGPALRVSTRARAGRSVRD